MSRCQIVCELSTNHGGDVDLAAQMIRDAASAGADWVKLQTYSLDRLNPKDPQAEWLRQAHLNRDAHLRLMHVAAKANVGFLSTPFDVGSLRMLRELGLKTFKIASSESERSWWRAEGLYFISWAWGGKRRVCWDESCTVAVECNLTAIPLYPTPLEAISRATLLEGWSDHVIGLPACQWALANGVKVLEVHFTNGSGRVMPWDKTPQHVEQLRIFAEDCATMRTGVATRFRERWQHGA